jgi:hypothetical protein
VGIFGATVPTPSGRSPDPEFSLTTRTQVLTEARCDASPVKRKPGPNDLTADAPRKRAMDNING